MRRCGWGGTLRGHLLSSLVFLVGRVRLGEAARYSMFKDYLGFPRAVYVLCLGSFINRAGTFLLPFLTLYLVGELGFQVRFATVGMSAYGAGAIVGALLGGYLADRIGRRAVMLISLLGGAVILRFFGYFTHPVAVLAAIVVFTVFVELYRPAATAMIADLVEPHRRAHAFSLMYVAINLGFAVGALVGGWLATIWFVWLFWGDALTAAIYALIILFCISETLPSRRRDADPAETGAAKPADTVRFETTKHILGHRTFLIFCLASLFCALVFFQMMSTFPLFLAQRGWGPQTYGRLVAVNGAMIVLCQLPVASLVTRFDRGTMVALAAVVLGIGFGLTNLATTAWHFAAVVAIWTCGELMQAPLMSTIVTDLAPARYRARYLGVFSMCFSSANMIGAPLGGLVLAHWGGVYLWGGCMAAALLAAVLFVCIRAQIAAPGEVAPPPDLDGEPA